MAYYTGPTGNSVASSTAKKNTVKKTNVNPGYGTQSAYQQYKLGRNNTLDTSRSGTNTTYGGVGRNASTGNGSSSKASTSSSSSGSSGSSKQSYTEYEETPDYQEQEAQEWNNSTANWNPNDLIKVYVDTLNERAKDAYDRSVGIVNDYYNSAKENLQKNYDESVGILNNNNNLNTANINADAEAAMRQAYINNMLSRRNLQQVLTAQGLNGGASETTRASMENNYGNARNNIDTTRNRNLADLAAQYNNNLTGLRQQLNTGLSDLDTRRLEYTRQANQDVQNILNSYIDKITDTIMSGYNNNNLSQMLSGIYIEDEGKKALDAYNGVNGAASLKAVPNNYTNQLTNIADALKQYQLDPAQVNNPYDPTTMQQAGQFAGSNYAKYLAAQDLLGANNPTAINAQVGNNGNVSSLQQILRQLGY